MNSKDFKNTCKTLCKKIIELEKTECIICTYPINVGTLLLPCSHYQVCFRCSTYLEDCPICRQKIDHHVNYTADENMKSLDTFIDAIGGISQ